MKSMISLTFLIFLVSCGGGSSSSQETPAATNNASANAPLLDTAPSSSSVPSETPSAPIVSDTEASADPSIAEAIKLNFHALVGKDDLLCTDQSESQIAKGQIFSDIRLFISNVTFINDKGQEIKLSLDVLAGSSNLQYVDKNQNSIALLNFLDGSCRGTDPSQKVKVDITGLLPQGNYTQIRFQIGLPYAAMSPSLTSVPAALAPSDMGWMWEHYPADLQIEANTGLANGSKRKVLNSLSTANKRLVTLPLTYTLNQEADKTVQLDMDFSKLFSGTPLDFLNGLESACNNNTALISETAPVCADAYKAFGLEVKDPKAPYTQSIFSIAP